jgi:hypothetical protein
MRASHDGKPVRRTVGVYAHGPAAAKRARRAGIGWRTLRGRRAEDSERVAGAAKLAALPVRLDVAAAPLLALASDTTEGDLGARCTRARGREQRRIARPLTEGRDLVSIAAGGLREVELDRAPGGEDGAG